MTEQTQNSFSRICLSKITNRKDLNNYLLKFYYVCGKIVTMSSIQSVIPQIHAVGLCLILFAAVLLCWKKSKKSRKALFFLVFLSGTALYFVGFDDGCQYWSTTLLRSLISSFHMFALHSDLIEVIPEMHHSKAYMLWFSTTHAIAFLLTFMVVVQLLGAKLWSWIKMRVSLKSIGIDNFIFLFSDSHSFLLAKDIIANHNERIRLVFFQDKADSEIFPHIESLHDIARKSGKKAEILIFQKYESKSIYRFFGFTKLFRGNTNYIFALSNEHPKNLQAATRITDDLKQLCQKTGIDPQIKLFIKSELEYPYDSFGKYRYANLEISIVNSSKLATFDLIIKHHPANYLTFDKEKAIALSDFTVLILGFGSVGQQVLRGLVEQGQFTGSAFHAYIFDRNMEAIKGKFTHTHPGLKNYDINYINADIGSMQFWETVEKEKINYVVVALGDTEQNIETTTLLNKFYDSNPPCRKVDIFTKVENESEYTLLMAENMPRIKIFGSEKAIYTEKTIIQKRLLRLAIVNHNKYNEKEQASNPTFKPKAWHELSDFERYSNISTTLHAIAKLKMTDLVTEHAESLPTADVASLRIDTFSGKCVYWSMPISSSSDFLEKLGRERVDNLAKTEHLRWNASLFANGWDTLQPNGSKSHKSPDTRRHACLVDWDEIKRIEDIYGIQFRQKDYDTIGNIWALLSQ